MRKTHLPFKMLLLLAGLMLLCACGKSADAEPLLTPEEVVRTWYLAHADDNYDRLNATLLTETNHPSDPPGCGLAGLVIHDIREYHGDRFDELADMSIESFGERWGLSSPENFAIVLADAQILYDTRLVGYQDSEECGFFLVRKDADSPWKIASCGAGYLSYRSEFGADADEQHAAQPAESAAPSAEPSPYARAAMAELAAMRERELTTDERSIRKTVECYIRVLEDQMLHYDTAEFDYAGVFFDPDSASPDSLAFSAAKSLLQRKTWRESGLQVLWSDVDVEITEVRIDGDAATAEAGSSLSYILEGQESTISGVGTAYSFTLTKREGAWRISSIVSDSEIDLYYDLEALQAALA